MGSALCGGYDYRTPGAAVALERGVLVSRIERVLLWATIAFVAFLGLVVLWGVAKRFGGLPFQS